MMSALLVDRLDAQMRRNAARPKSPCRIEIVTRSGERNVARSSHGTQIQKPFEATTVFQWILDHLALARGTG
jgi:hypothetical protein